MQSKIKQTTRIVKLYCQLHVVTIPTEIFLRYYKRRLFMPWFI